MDEATSALDAESEGVVQEARCNKDVKIYARPSTASWLPAGAVSWSFDLFVFRVGSARSSRTDFLLCDKQSLVREGHSPASGLPQDEIICLREGHVVERGTSKELMELRGYYFTLVEKQAAALLN